MFCQRQNLQKIFWQPPLKWLQSMPDIVVLGKRVGLLRSGVTSGNGSHQRSQSVFQLSSVISSARQRLKHHNHNKNQSIGVRGVKKSLKAHFKKRFKMTLLGQRNFSRNNFVTHEILRGVHVDYNKKIQRFRVRVS
jgi:hypothetical protein